MRWIGGIVLAIVVLVGLFTLRGEGPTVPGLGLGTPPPEEQANLGYSAKAARMVQTDEQGVPQYTLEAEEMHQPQASQDIVARTLTLHYAPPANGSAPPWVLTAREGTLPLNETSVKLRGDVRLVGRPAGARADVSFDTQSLDVDVKAQTARTSAPVTWVSGQTKLTARGLDADMKRGNLRLESSVHGRFSP